jgi:AcrR family transcriptional regulator
MVRAAQQRDDVMTEPGTTSDRRRPNGRSRRASANREALIRAAGELFARSGPGAVSIRTLADHAGCSHTLIGRNFGSKDGLERAVIEQVADRLRTLADAASTTSTWSAAAVLAGLRSDPQEFRLATRAALGEFDATPIRDAATLGPRLAAQVEGRRGGNPDAPSPSARATAFFALNTILGHLTFEPLLVWGSRARQIPEEVRDGTVVEAADVVIELGSDPATDLGWGPEPRRLPQRPTVVDPDLTAREALLVATIDLHVERGPGQVTTRDIAERADVNQGLIYHYFDSVEALTTEAFALAASPFGDSAVSHDRFDLRRLARERPDLDFLVIIARHLLDGGDPASIGASTRVFDSILDGYATVPTGPGPGGLGDPRLATMAASGYFQGTAVWDRLVRDSLGIPMTADLSAAGITVVTALLDRPRA